jgi:hypothetical protein
MVGFHSFFFILRNEKEENQKKEFVSEKPLQTLIKKEDFKLFWLISNNFI